MYNIEEIAKTLWNMQFAKTESGRNRKQEMAHY